MWKKNMILYFKISKTNSKITILSNSKITRFKILRLQNFSITNGGDCTPIYTMG
jgi:hypothetical protein